MYSLKYLQQERDRFLHLTEVSVCLQRAESEMESSLT